jgi:hypothetical protein
VVRPDWYLYGLVNDRDELEALLSRLFQSLAGADVRLST